MDIIIITIKSRGKVLNSFCLILDLWVSSKSTLECSVASFTTNGGNTIVILLSRYRQRDSTHYLFHCIHLKAPIQFSESGLIIMQKLNHNVFNYEIERKI